MRVQRVDEQLAALEQPASHRIESILLNEGDALIVCAGFEDRSLAVLRAASVVGQGEPSIILIEYLPIVPGNHLEECLQACDRLGVSPTRLKYDRENPVGAALEIWSRIADVKGRVHIDVSGMSRLLIVQLLAACGKMRGSFRNISILYAEAERYHPTREEFEHRASRPGHLAPLQFLSWGVSQITVVPELSSVALEEQPTHLIAFPTFDPQQFAAVRKDVDPSKITVIHGELLILDGEWRREAIKGLNGIGSLQIATEYTTSTYDYRETVAVLLKIYSEVGRLQRMIICPTGSKMQTVAVGLVRAFLQDMTIVYPTPRSFKTEAYTSGAKQIHILHLDEFSSVAQPTSDADASETCP